MISSRTSFVLVWNSTCKHLLSFLFHPANIYLFKVNNRNIKIKSEICSKLTKKTPEQCHCRRSAIFIVKFKYFSFCTVDFELVHVCWPYSPVLMCSKSCYFPFWILPSLSRQVHTCSRNTRTRRGAERSKIVRHTSKILQNLL